MVEFLLKKQIIASPANQKYDSCDGCNHRDRRQNTDCTAQKGNRLEGKWEFPGGKIEEGESPEACLQRELQEEFGIETRIGDFICQSEYEYPHIHILLLAYQTYYLSGEFQLYDHAAIQWVTLEEIQAYDFAPADIPIVEALLK